MASPKSGKENVQSSKDSIIQQDSNPKPYPSRWNVSNLKEHFNLDQTQYNGFRTAITKALQDNDVSWEGNLFLPSQQVAFTAAVKSVNYSEAWLRDLDEWLQDKILRHIGRAIVIAERNKARSRVKRHSARDLEVQPPKKRRNQFDESDPFILVQEAGTVPNSAKRSKRFSLDSAKSNKEVVDNAEKKKAESLETKSSGAEDAAVSHSKEMGDTNNPVEKGVEIGTTNGTAPAPMRPAEDHGDRDPEENNLPQNQARAGGGDSMQEGPEPPQPASADDYLFLPSFRDLPPRKDVEQNSPLISEGSDIPFRTPSCSPIPSTRSKESASPSSTLSLPLSKATAILDGSEKGHQPSRSRTSSPVRSERPRILGSSLPPPSRYTQSASAFNTDTHTHNTRNLMTPTQTPTSASTLFRKPFHDLRIRTTTANNDLESVTLTRDICLSTLHFSHKLFTPTSPHDLSFSKWLTTLTEDINYNPHTGIDSLTFVSKRSGIARPIFNERQWRAAISEAIDDDGCNERPDSGSGSGIEICFMLRRV